VIIRAPDQSEDLTQRSSIKVIEAANRAIRGSNIVMVYWLPSSNTILIFKGKAEEYTKETAWV
jgi:hypothetical protein